MGSTGGAAVRALASDYYGSIPELSLLVLSCALRVFLRFSSFYKNQLPNSNSIFWDLVIGVKTYEACRPPI